MESGRVIAFANQLVLTRDFSRAADHSTIYREVDGGRLIRVATGAFLPAAIWRALDVDERFVVRVIADSLLFPRDRPYSHVTAAGLWRLPIIGSWPGRLESLLSPSADLGSRTGLQRRVGPPDGGQIAIDGIAVTSLARTIVDVARTRRAAVGVAMADYSLRAARSDAVGVDAHRVNVDELHVQLELLAGARGIVSAQRIVTFADGKSGSPGESVSRLAMWVLGFPPPVLQQAFFDRDGLIGIVDFWWPEFGVIGEFDGWGKYVREEFQRGRPSEEVLRAEKARENRLRRTGPTVARWEWEDALTPRRLEAILLEAGLPKRRILRSTPADPQGFLRKTGS